MNKKSKLKKRLQFFVGSIAGIAILLFLVLFIHIAIMVKGKPPIVDPTIQMARADFQQPVDSLSALRIENKIQTQKGVHSTFFNAKTNIIIYTFDNRVNNAQNIYNHAIKNSGFLSTRYVVAASDLKNGCPVMNGDSFYGHLTTWVSKVVN